MPHDPGISSSPNLFRNRAHTDGNDRLHQPKWDSFRFQVIKDDVGNRFFPRHGAELTDRLPRMVEALTKLPDPIHPRRWDLLVVPRGAAFFTADWPRCAPATRTRRS